MDRRAARRAARASRPPLDVGPYTQATLVDYDPVTQLSTVDLPGVSEIENVPKLDSVKFPHAPDVSPVSTGTLIFHTRRTSALTLTSGATTAVNLQVVADTYDPYDLFVGQAAATSFIPPWPGWWRFETHLCLSGGSGSRMLVGTRTYGIDTDVASVNPPTTGNPQLSHCSAWPMNGTTDTVELIVIANGTGGQLSLATSTGRNYLKMIYAGPVLPEPWDPAGIEVLCIRTANRPLTIVGVLTGSTI